MTNDLQIRLSWEKPATGEAREPVENTDRFWLRIPRLPAKLRGMPVTRILLNSNVVSRYHALIDWAQAASAD